MTTDLYLGVDPGKKGAWAILNADGTPLHVEALPYMGDRLDIRALLPAWQAWLSHGGQSYAAAMEYPLAVQGQSGGEQAFLNFGILIAAATLCGCSLHLPKPHIWKGKMNLSRDKSMSLKMVADLWPDWYPKVTGPRGGMLDGLAEALLIAEWRRRAELRIRTPEVRRFYEQNEHNQRVNAATTRSFGGQTLSEWAGVD